MEAERTKIGGVSTKVSLHRRPTEGGREDAPCRCPTNDMPRSLDQCQGRSYPSLMARAQDASEKQESQTGAEEERAKGRALVDSSGPRRNDVPAGSPESSAAPCWPQCRPTSGLVVRHEACRCRS